MSGQPPEGAPDPGDVARRLAAARLVALDAMPYFGSALFAMVAVPAPGLGTFACDSRWRFYYDPAVVLRWTVPQVAGVVLHEVGHLVRAHAERFEALSEPADRHPAWNAAGDVLINEDLLQVGVELPAGALRLAHVPGAQPGMTVEAVYRLLRLRQDPAGHAAAGGRGSAAARGTGLPAPGASGEAPPWWDCGSGADSVRRAWEGAADSAGLPGLEPGTADLIRQRVAADVAAAAKSRGDLPAGLVRWAADLLDPVVDWRRELAGLVRARVASVAGRRDYTYARPSRRQPAAPAGAAGTAVLPAMRQPPPPRIAVVVDTSGSMGDPMVDRALAEVRGLLRAVGSSGRDVPVVSCDAEAQVGRASRAGATALTGGGGTDMRVGVDAAVALKPRPAAVVVLTDGYTPLPDGPVPGVALVWGVVAESPEEAAPVVEELRAAMPWARVLAVVPGA